MSNKDNSKGKISEVKTAQANTSKPKKAAVSGLAAAIGAILAALTAFIAWVVLKTRNFVDEDGKPGKKKTVKK